MQPFKNRQIPAGNPLANILVVVVGVVIIAVSFVLGLVAIVALASALLIMAAIIGVRIWWLKRKIGGRNHRQASPNMNRSRRQNVIEGEYHVVQTKRDREPRDPT